MTANRCLIVHWEHRRGGHAHALARFIEVDDRPPVVVVSEIRSNPDHLGVSSDFAAAAEAALAELSSDRPLDPATIVWLAHHGSFSYYDPGGPDTYTRVHLRWDGVHYHDRLADHRLLTEAEAAGVLGDVTLAPVPQALADLGWGY